MRAIAVLAVVLYHASIRGFNGGFFGVDVFFVISGFVITRKTLSDLSSGEFSPFEFYRRRVRRILPAVIVILFVTTFFAHKWLLPVDYMKYSETLKSVLTLTSNRQIARETNYFSPDTAFLPLAHLWSLAIEEQFYLVFPIVVFFMNTKRRLAIILIAVSAWSLITMILSSTETSAPYFSTSNRIAQLAFGGLCALFVSSKMHTELRANIKTIVNAVALAVLLLLIPFYSAKQAVPSILSLVPVGLTCIFLVLPRKQIIVSVLSFKPIQIIGRASFSIYLVHQPLLAFSKILIYGTPYSMPTAIEKSAMVAGCVLTGVVSWRLIEEPVRRLRGKLEIVSVVAILASAVLLYVHANRVIETGGYPKRIPASAAETLARRDIAMASAELKMVRDCAYETSFVDLGTSKDNAEFQRCTNTYGPPILVAGDSHAEDLFNALSINLPERFVLGVYRHSASHAEFADELSKTITISKPNLQVILFTLEASTWIDSNIIQIDQLKIDTNVILDSAIQIQKYEKFVWLGPQIEPRIDLYGFNPLVGIVRELNTVRMSEQLSIQVDKIFKRLAKKSAVAYLSKIEIVKFDYRKDFDVPEGFTYGDRTHWSTVGEKVFGKRIIDDPRIQELLK
jgi:peptidoglycan/LPS O-acetylase OafA/YrhL